MSDQSTREVRFIPAFYPPPAATKAATTTQTLNRGQWVRCELPISNISGGLRDLERLLDSPQIQGMRCGKATIGWARLGSPSSDRLPKGANCWRTEQPHEGPLGGVPSFSGLGPTLIWAGRSSKCVFSCYFPLQSTQKGYNQNKATHLARIRGMQLLSCQGVFFELSQPSPST